MFFWFASETFSIIDALLKLFLVITGSALIICLCHRLTNYKKSRRYKPQATTRFAPPRYNSYLQLPLASHSSSQLQAFDTLNLNRVIARLQQQQILPTTTLTTTTTSAGLPINGLIGFYNQSLVETPAQYGDITNQFVVPPDITNQALQVDSNIVVDQNNCSRAIITNPLTVYQTQQEVADVCPSYEEAVGLVLSDTPNNNTNNQQQQQQIEVKEEVEEEEAKFVTDDNHSNTASTSQQQTVDTSSSAFAKT